MPGRWQPVGSVCGARTLTAALPASVIVLGPFSAGVVVRRVCVSLSRAGGATDRVAFGGSFTPSPDPTEANIASGTQLINDSGLVSNGVRYLEMAALAANAMQVEMYPGVEIGSGSVWLVCAVSCPTLAGSATCVVSAEAWRWVTEAA